MGNMFMICVPKKNAINVPSNINGPKGIVDPCSFFLFDRISSNATSAPTTKAIYNATIVPCNPKKIPMKKANFTSPNPIPRPMVIRNKNKKNPNPTSAAMMLSSSIVG